MRSTIERDQKEGNNTVKRANTRFFILIGLIVSICALSSCSSLKLERANQLAREARNLSDATRTDAAILRAEEALKQSPDAVEAHLVLGNIRSKQGKVEEAYLHFSTAYALAPDNEEASVGLVEALERQGKVALAKEKCDQFQYEHPNSIYGSRIETVLHKISGKIAETNPTIQRN